MSVAEVDGNPFPGPQPYTAHETAFFFGREHVTSQVVGLALTHRCVVLYGASGAGKSSLLQAGVIPQLEAQHAFRCVRVDTWPTAVGSARLAIAEAITTTLGLGPGEETDPVARISDAVDRAFQRSDRPLLVVLDQLEQVLVLNEEASAFFAAVDTIVAKPIRGLQLMLSLREDYLGRLRDRIHRYHRLNEQTFRLSALTVGEMSDAVCEAARKGGRQWERSRICPLVLQVRADGLSPTDDAEVQAAYGQIVCRELWKRGWGKEASEQETPPDAETLLGQYRDATFAELGEKAENARRLTERELIDANGNRTLRSVGELVDEMGPQYGGPGEVREILEELHRAKILRRGDVAGTEYYQLGHDWLARRLKEDRLEQERRKKEDRREEERREEAKLRIDKLTKWWALVSAVLVCGLTVSTCWTFQAERKAEDAAKAASVSASFASSSASFANSAAASASVARDRAADALVFLGAAQLRTSDPGEAIHVLRAATTADAPVWRQAAVDALRVNAPTMTLPSGETFQIDSQLQLTPLAGTADGSRIISAGRKVALVWNTNSPAAPVVVGTTGPLWTSFDPTGSYLFTTDEEGGHLWSASTGAEWRPLPKVVTATFRPDGKSLLAIMKDEKKTSAMEIQTRASLMSSDGALLYDVPAKNAIAAAFSNDGKVLVVLTTAGVHAFAIDDTSIRKLGQPVQYQLAKKSEAEQHAFAALAGEALSIDASGGRVAIVTPHGALLSWAPGSPTTQRLGKGKFAAAAVSPDGAWIAAIPRTAVGAQTEETTAVTLFDAATGIERRSFFGIGPVLSIAWSADSQLLAIGTTASGARVFDVKSVLPVVLDHSAPVTAIRFLGKERRIVTVSGGMTRIWDPLAPGVVNAFDDARAMVVSSTGDIAVLSNKIKVVHADGRVTNVDTPAHTWMGPPVFAPDGKRLAVVVDKVAMTYSLAGKTEPVSSVLACEKPCEAVSVTWSRATDGEQRIAVGCGSAAAKPDGVSFCVFTGEGKYLGAGTLPFYDPQISLSDDGASLMATGGFDPREYDIWNTSDLTKPFKTWVDRTPSNKTPDPTGTDLFGAGLSHDGKSVAVYKRDTLAIHSMSGEPVSVGGFTGSVQSVGWCKNDSLLAAVFDDHEVRIWSVASPEVPMRTWQADGAVSELQFDADQTRLLATMTAGGATIWDLRDGSRIVLSPSEAQREASWQSGVAAFLPDRRIVTSMPLRRWSLEIPELQKQVASLGAGCTNPTLLQRYIFNETRDKASAHFDACLKGYGWKRDWFHLDQESPSH